MYDKAVAYSSNDGCNVKSEPLEISDTVKRIYSQLDNQNIQIGELYNSVSKIKNFDPMASDPAKEAGSPYNGLVSDLHSIETMLEKRNQELNVLINHLKKLI